LVRGGGAYELPPYGRGGIDNLREGGKEGDCFNI